MGRTRWTKPQAEFLWRKFPGFEPQQASGGLTVWFAEIHQEYFAEFIPLTAKIGEDNMQEWLTKEKKAIQDWFYATKRTLLLKGLFSRQVKASASDKAEAALKDPSALKRSWTLLKAYIKFWCTPHLEFCSTILQMTKDTEVVHSVKLTAGEIMNLCHTLGSQLLQLEPNLVKDAILELSCKSRENVALNKVEMQAPVDISTLTPEQIHAAKSHHIELTSAVIKLPKIMELMLLNRTILQSGFEGFVLIGGPDPSLPGGAIHPLIFHFGPEGKSQNFCKWYLHFDEAVLTPFSQYLEERFCTHLHPESVCYFTDKQNSTRRLPSRRQWNGSPVPPAQNCKPPAEDFIPGCTPQTNASTSAGDVFSLLEASKVGGLEMFGQNPLFNMFNSSSCTPSVPQAIPATSDLLILPQMPGFMGNLDDFIATLNSNEDTLVGGTSGIPDKLTQTDSRDGGMEGIMEEIGSLDFSCMGTGTDESGFNGTPGANFLASTAVNNMSGLHLPAHTTPESNFRGNYGVVTEPEVITPFVRNKIVKPTGITMTLDGLLSGISLSLLLSSSSGYTPSLPARSGPSPPGAMSPARSTSSIDFTESMRPMAPLDNPSLSVNDDSVTQMDTDVHDNSTISTTAPNVEDAKPQSPEVEAVSNELSRPSVTPLGDNEIDRQICKDPAPTGKENVRPLRDRKAMQQANGPDWHDTMKAELLSNDFGSDWVDCVSQWHEFEGMLTTNSNGQFHSRGRPKKLSSWLSSQSRLPFKSKNWDLEEIGVFGNEMEAWWNQAQPKW
ncbi:hypothetical protein ARMSODRAFT_983852 [Armillaria solidipes]|uniref:Uncharacterized protein n=1 Tax=Armillaria solidipes TaxID=1076256 RepID=A0A2H3AHG6_9AGAR|nr:hypothetical protein ARMSODRAFT_983852 [Armillaria solidipes]